MSDATSEPPLAAAADDEPLPPPPSVEAQPAPATNDTSTAVGDDEIELHPLEVANKSPAASEEDAESLPPSTRARATGRRPSQLEVTQELSDAYNKEANPSAEDISALAQRTGLSEQQVSTFFANKRARDRAAEAKAEAVGAAVAAAAVPLAPSSQVDDVLTAITNEDGGLADPENAQQLVKLMQMQLNMDDQLLLLAVILATKSFACRKRLLELGGLPPICEWLAAAKRDNKVPLQKELLRVLECLPIKVEQLRATSAGKVVKGLKTSTDPDVRLRADRLVAVWMSLVAAVDPGAAAAPSVVNPSSSSGEKRAHDTAPTHTPTPMDADAARKRAAPAPVPAGGAASGATSKASAAVAVAKKPRLEDAAAAPAKKPPAPTPAPAPKPKPEALKPKVVSATTTLAANDDFDVLTKKKSIVPEHLKKPAARTALLIEGDDKKKDEARPAKDAASSFTSKPISADEIRKEKQRQKALGVDKAEPRLESKPGQGAAVAAQLGRIVAAVASGSLTSSDPLAAADAAAASASASTAAAAPSVPSVPSLNPASAAPAAAAKVEEAAAATVAQGKGKPKKRLTWADHHGAPLKRIKTFKKDKPDFSPEAQQAPNRDAFVKAAHMEHQREKENLLKEKKAHTLDLKVTIAWFRPRPLQLADPQPVADTAEARAQKERERAILLDMQAFRADRTIDMSKVPDTPLEPEPEPANDDAKVVVIPADDQQAASAVADPNAAAAAAAGLAPNLLSLANLHTVLSQMPGQPVAAPPPPAPVMPMAMPPMDASMLVHALASLVGAGAPPPAVAHPMPPQYYGPPGGFSPAPNAPHMQGPPPGYNRDRDRERGVDPSPDLLARRHNILCQYFLKGDCKYGARCHFSHTPSEDDIKNAKRKRGGR